MNIIRNSVLILCLSAVTMPCPQACALTGEQAWQLAGMSGRYKASGERLFKAMEALNKAMRGQNAERVQVSQRQWEDRLDSLIIAAMLKDNITLAEAAARCTDERAAWAEGVLTGRVRLEGGLERPSSGQLQLQPAFRATKTGLFQACRSGDLESVRMNVEGRIDVNSRDSNGNTPLMLAVKEGHADIAEYLLSRGADWKLANSMGFPAPAYITDNNAARLMSVFMRHGMSMGITFGEDGRTLLHNAVRSGYAGLARVLMERGADPNARNRDKETPMHYVAYVADHEKTDHKKMVQALLQGGAVIDARNKAGGTPLYLAVLNKHEKAAIALIQAGAEVNQKGRGQESMLYFAVDQELYDTAGELIRRNADLGARGDDWQGMMNKTPAKLRELQKRGYIR
ncbi:MAG: ankyrin repeat domain-containing protein [Mailhella sp.]|nr:ankyrin repeat domain-containing protein [Mailhella sp.]